MQETRIKVTKKIIRLAAAFPHANLTEDTFDVYAEALEDVPEQILDVVLTQAAMESEFFPTLHRIRETIVDMMYTAPSPEAAWEEVQKWLNYSDGKLETPLVKRVVSMMGQYWGLRNGDASVLRAQFLKMYGNLRDEQRNEYMKIPAYKEFQKRLGQGAFIKGVLEASNGES